MTKLDEGIFALFDDGEMALVVSGRVIWLTLPGAAWRKLRSGFYDLDMRYLGAVVDDVCMHREIEVK